MKDEKWVMYDAVDNNVEYVNTEEEADKKSIFSNFEAISESPKKMSSYEEAQELLYMFYKKF